MVPIINKSTKVTRNTATAIDHFITNSAVDTQREYKQTRIWLKNKHEHFVYKRHYDKKLTNIFKQKLHKTTWDNINIKEPNKAYKKFLEIFSCIFKSFFLKKRIRVKLKKLNEPLGN